MDPYEIGKTYHFAEGSYVYKGGDASDAASWSPAQAETSSPEDAALARTSARGGNGLTDFLAMARHGATLGLDDEIAGVIKGPQARDEIRQRIADRRLLNPGASALSEVAGSVPQALLPVGAGMNAAKTGGGLLGTMAKGAFMGGVQGAAYGAGDANTDRGSAAVMGGLFGAGTGALAAGAPAAANAVARRTTGRLGRLLGAAEETTGLSSDINAVRDAADAEVSAARAQHFAPLDAMGKVDDADIAVFMKARNLSAKPRTLPEMQKVLKSLKRTDPAAADDLSDLMRKAWPGLEQANTAYAPAVQGRGAIQAGEKAASKPGADIARALEKTPTDAQANFRQGQFHRLADKLRGAGDEQALSVLKTYDARGQLRPLFDTDASYNEFVGVLNREKSAEKVLKLLPWVSGGIGAGGLFGALKLRQRL